MRATFKSLAITGLILTSSGTALAADISAAPFLKNGTVAFAVKNHSKTQTISVGNFQTPHQKDMLGPCPNGPVERSAITLAPGGQGTIETSVTPQQLVGCLARAGQDRYNLASILKISGIPNEAIPPGPSGYIDVHYASFAYSYEFSGSGWKTNELTAGYVYFEQGK